MMADTLQLLASHKRSQEKYVIFLAMEGHEEGSELKAQELIRRFDKKFKAIDFTQHKVQPNEQKGKASNVSWCAEHL
jgi:hypothetical protein